jgi:hypothetical protein
LLPHSTNGRRGAALKQKLATTPLYGKNLVADDFKGLPLMSSSRT